MFKQELLEEENYWSFFDRASLFDSTMDLIQEQSEEADIIGVYHPQAVLLSDIDADRFFDALSFMGRLAWQKDWAKNPEKFVEHIINMGHESVIEHMNFSWIILCDRATSHEFVRHRIGMSPTQESQRYVGYEKVDETAGIVLPYGVTEEEEYFFVDSGIMSLTQYRIGVNLMQMKKEQARLVLPNMMGTKIGATFNPRSLRHFLGLRMAKGAYPQIRAIANDIYDSVEDAGLGVLLTGLEDLKEFDPRTIL